MSNKEFDLGTIGISDYEREILKEISKDTSGNGNIDFHEWMEGFPELHEDEGMWEEMEKRIKENNDLFQDMEAKISNPNDPDFKDLEVRFSANAFPLGFLL